MKTTKFISALMMGFAVVACSPKGENAAEGEAAKADSTVVEEAPKEMTAKDYLPTKQEKNDVSYLLGVNFGSFIKGYNFGDINYKEMIKGIEDFVNAKGNPRDPQFGEQFKVNPERINELFNSYLENRRNYVALSNKEKENKFLADNKKKDGVQVTESGLQYEIIEKGNDVFASDADTVYVFYKGTLIDGTEFDATAPDAADPVKLVLTHVVPGWQEGLKLIGEGGKIKLFVPSELGYGENGAQAIEPNSTLIFDVTLVKVGKYVAPTEEEVKAKEQRKKNTGDPEEPAF